MTPFKPALVVVMIGLLFSAGIVPSAKAEQPDLSQSRHAQGALREHRLALHELEDGYFKSLDLAAERFAKSSTAHVRRYIDGMNRFKTQHKRDGNESTVVFIEALIDLASSWKLSAPDAQGMHFLSDADLVVQGDEEATKLGTDLVARIERLVPAYQRQVDSAFSRYEKNVQSEWKAYIKALEKARLEELRAGRHKAVIQIEEALEGLKSQALKRFRDPDRGSA